MSHSKVSPSLPTLLSAFLLLGGCAAPDEAVSAGEAPPGEVPSSAGEAADVLRIRVKAPEQEDAARPGLNVASPTGCQVEAPAISCWSPPAPDWCTHRLTSSTCYAYICGYSCNGQCIYNVCSGLECMFEPRETFNTDCL
jgi:hypothetical protein